MTGVEEAQKELCSKCPDNILGICNPSEAVCGDVMRLSALFLLRNSAGTEPANYDPTIK